MKKGITLYYGYNTPIEERLTTIKKAGFNNIITCADKRFNHQNGSIEKQIKLLQTVGLGVSSLHMQYKQEDLQNFFKKGLSGYILQKKLEKDVKIAKKYGFSCVVVHLAGEPNEIGWKRLRQVLKCCHKTNIPLAIENLNDCRGFFECFKNIKDDYLKFCWDVGHSNCFTKDLEFVKELKDKLITLHLHDNNGKEDQHTLNKYGTINWDEIAEILASLDHEINLDYEILMHYRQNETPEEVAEETYRQSCELEKLILKHKNKTNQKSLS